MYSKTGKRLIIPYSSMRILVFLFISIFSAISVQAQSQDLEKEMQIMVNRVDSLEHELAYLRLTYELDSRATKIQLFNGNVSNSSLSVQLNYYNRNIDSNYAKSSQELYESFLSGLLSERSVVNQLKLYSESMIASYHFSESELTLLAEYNNVLEKSLEQLEQSVKLLRISVDAYEDLVNKSRRYR